MTIPVLHRTVSISKYELIFSKETVRVTIQKSQHIKCTINIFT